VTLPGWLNRSLTALALFAGLLALATFVSRTRSGEAVRPPAVGLPRTPDYHSLLVDDNDGRHLWLGTHLGLYESTDGGRSWRAAGLEGRDVMNLTRGRDGTLWATGHNVAATSRDEGRTWVDLRPRGLPSLDIHGFAVDPKNPKRLYAAIAGQGLYRSDDGGQSFKLLSSTVGGAVFALAVTPDGRLLAGDQEQGLLASTGGGKTWTPVVHAGIVGLAVNPGDSETIVAGGPGILRSTDGGRRWRQALAVPEGAGPVAWSRSDPDVGYAVGFDRVFYRTSDRGRTWQPVG
jgi:photosystem II stability/assembly factor-like uncharacterized protein